MFLEEELWNIDLWFFDKETIRKSEQYCDDIVNRVNDEPDLKKSIINLKRELMNRNQYSFYQYTSVDVYEAVLNRHIFDIDSFLANYSKN